MVSVARLTQSWGRGYLPYVLPIFVLQKNLFLCINILYGTWMVLDMESGWLGHGTRMVWIWNQDGLDMEPGWFGYGIRMAWIWEAGWFGYGTRMAICRDGNGVTRLIVEGGLRRL
jgi:hypothetical protein